MTDLSGSLTSDLPGNGSQEAFDHDWQEALSTRDPRWLSYPAETPTTQTEMFELVKARQIVNLLSTYGIRAGKILEFGCGAAGMSVFLANKGFQVCAADISANALRVANLNAGFHGSPIDLDLLRADTFKLPFKAGSFDVTMSHGLLEHFDEPQVPELLHEVLRVLKPGGLFLSDIVPGPRRLSVRTLGLVLSYLASVTHRMVRGQFKQTRRLYDAYFGHLYENSLGDREWARILERMGLHSVHVQVCRPFPPLALAGRLERGYVNALQAALPMWQRFDASDSWFSRRWGWMYLAHGIRPEANSRSGECE